MSRFRPGQRVRIVRCSSADARCFIGHEGRILGECSIWAGCYDVSGATHMPDGVPVCWRPESLEPILDQHQPADDEALLRDLDRMASLVGEPA